MASGYAYIYDDFLNDKKYEREIAQLEGRLASLDLVGRISRLALFRSAKDLVESLAAQGVTTLVVVGNDRTLDKILWFVPGMQMTLGYLPIAEPHGMADLLGIPCGEAACDILAARLIEKMDMGRLDDRYFLTEVRLDDVNAALDVEGRFRLSPIGGGSISIRNLGGIGASEKSDVRDGMLEAVITPKPEQSGGFFSRPMAQKPTTIKFSHGEIISPDPVEAKVDSHTINSLRFRLGVETDRLAIITGRRRRAASAVTGLPRQTDFANLPVTRKRSSAGGGIGIRTSLRG